MKDKLEQFFIDRDYILANIENLTIEQIKEHCNKYGIPMPNNEKSILGGLHKARLNVTGLRNITPEELKELQEISKKWLDGVGFSHEII